MVGFILVSHSDKLAEGVKDIIEQMNGGQANIKAVGGVGDGRIGTNPIRIQEAIEELYDGSNILIFGDLGSSIMSAQMAIDMVENDISEKTILVDAPLVEGAIAAVVQASITENLDDILQAAQEAKTISKF
jgi:phosphoenolpyruvate---glycerone phosphotransferase subunit DhaM